MTERTAKPITLVFIDDSGDSGFKLGAGSSAYFVVGLVIFRDAHEAERAAEAIKRLRATLGFNDRFEFKFNKSKAAVRTAFFREVVKCDFGIRTLIVDKKRVRPEEHLRDKESFYAYFIMRALKDCGSQIRDARVHIDGGEDGPFRRGFVSYLRRSINGKDADRLAREFRFEDSQHNVLIQLADMVAGAIHRARALGDTTYRNILTNKIEEERNFP